MRSSLSCARRRRLRCLPSPAASSISIRRSRGLEVTIASTRPWETTECISLPRPVSDSISITSVSRQRAPLTRYSPSPARLSLRDDRDLARRQVDGAVRVVEHHLDLGLRARLHAVRAGEDHVLHRLAADGQRRLLAERPQHRVGDVGLAGAVRADDHRHARRELQPGAVGERLEALEGERPQVHRQLVIASSAASAAACSASFFERPEPRADLLAAHHRGHLEDPLVRRPVLRRHAVGHERPAARQALLQRRLEVRRRVQRQLDLRRERLDHRLGGLLVAEVQVAGADHGLDHRGQHPLGVRQRLGRRPARVLRRGGPQALRQPEPLRDLPARAPRDGLGADLGQPAGAVRVGLQPRPQVRRDRQPEHRVAQEGQPLVGLRAALDPRGVRHRLPGEIVRQSLQQVVSEELLRESSGLAV